MSEATHPIDADGVNGTGNGNGNGNGSSNGVNGTNGINDNIISATNTNTVARPRARLGPTEIVTIPDDSDSEDGDEIADKDGEESVEGQADFLRSYPDDTEVSPTIQTLVLFTSDTAHDHSYLYTPKHTTRILG